MKKSGGLWIDSDIRYSARARRQYPSVVSESVALLLCVLGGIITLHFTLQMPLNVPVYAVAVLCSVLFPSLYHLKKSWRFVLPLLGALLLAGFFLRRELWKGFGIFRMELFNAINEYFHTRLFADYVRYETVTATIFTVALICLLTALLGYAVAVHRSYQAIALAALPIAWMAVNLRERPLLSGLVLLVLSFYMVYAMRCGELRAPLPTQGDFSHSRGSRRLHKAYAPYQAKEAFLKNGLAVLAMALAVSLGVGLFVPRDSYTWNETLVELHQDPFSFFKKYSPDRLTGSTASQGISGGPLGRADRVEYQNELQLRIQYTDYRSPLYLKGYVGSVYKGDRWVELEESVYRKERALFESLEAAGETPLSIANDFNRKLIGMSEGGGEGIGKPVLNSITLQNMGALSHVLYTPYYLYTTPSSGGWKAENFWYDAVMRASSTQEEPYTLKSYLYGQPSGGVIPGGFMERYGLSGSASLNAYYQSQETGEHRALREGYRAFAQTYYTRLPEKGLSRLRADYSPEAVEGLTLAERVQKVREDLSLRAYDLAPGRTPSGEDFAEYFLYEQGRGYCMHFATAAALMFRAMGIPARYAEGYIVTEKDYTSPHTADIYDRSAHAWPEIYVEPFGWVPIEVTPGFAVPPTVLPEPSGQESVGSEPARPEKPESGASSGLFSETEVSGETSEASQTAESESFSDAGSGIDRPDSAQNSYPGGQPTKPSGESWDEFPPEAREDLPDSVKRLLILLGAILGGLLLLLGLLFLRRRMAQERRGRAFSQRDRNKAALAVYRYLLRLLSFAGFRPGNQTPEAFAAYVMRHCEAAIQAAQDDMGGDSLDFIMATEIVLEARFSGRMISQEKLDGLRAFARRLDAAVCQPLSPIQRLRYQFVDNLQSI